MKQIKIAIADDQQLVLEGIRMLVDKIKNVKVIITATDGYDLLAQLARAPKLPELLLLDLQMPGPGGNNTLADIRVNYKDLKVLIVSGYTAPAHIFTAFRQGANGFVSKDVSHEELSDAIRLTIKDGHFLSPRLTAKLNTEELELIFANRLKLKDLKKLCAALTPIDMEIIKLISNGLTSKEISEILLFSIRTIEGRRLKILKKVGVTNTAGLIRKAKDMGWCH
jgi:DNA-binding NarL/FixJ family response regulator